MPNNMKNKKPLLCSARVRRDWSELPRDISTLIGDKMGFLPHLQKFGAASKEWRDITCEIIERVAPKIKREPPMLLLPYNPETQTATFVEMKNSKMYDLKMPELKDQWICGASNGWLAMVDNNLDLFLFSTVTHARIKAPPLPPFQLALYRHMLNPNVSDTDYRSRFVHKVVLSGDPSSPECLVAIIYFCSRLLAVCRLGDEDWTGYKHWMGHEEDSKRCLGYKEIFFYQEIFFAVKERFESIDVYEYHKQGSMQVVKVIKEPLVNCERDPICTHIVKKYLVEISGDLFLIRIVSQLNTISSGFEVHKFEENGKEEVRWNRVYNLGDRALFLGDKGCICMPVKEFPWCKPNCIYFIDDTCSFRRHGYEWDNGVYSLEENRVIARFDIQRRITNWPYPTIWCPPKEVFFAQPSICTMKCGQLRGEEQKWIKSICVKCKIAFSGPLMLCEHNVINHEDDMRSMLLCSHCCQVAERQNANGHLLVVNKEDFIQLTNEESYKYIIGNIDPLAGFLNQLDHVNLGFEERVVLAIQQRGISPLSGNKDLICQSVERTMSCFWLNVLEGLDYALPECQALILAPTRNHCREIEDTMKSVKATRCQGVKVYAAIEDEVFAADMRSHVVMGTPGHVLELLNFNFLNPHNIMMLVIQDIHGMLYRDFGHQIYDMVQLLPQVFCINMMLLPTS